MEAHCSHFLHQDSAADRPFGLGIPRRTTAEAPCSRVAGSAPTPRNSPQNQVPRGPWLPSNTVILGSGVKSVFIYFLFLEQFQVYGKIKLKARRVPPHPLPLLPPVSPVVTTSCQCGAFVTTDGVVYSPRKPMVHSRGHSWAYVVGSHQSKVVSHHHSVTQNGLTALADPLQPPGPLPSPAPGGRCSFSCLLQPGLLWVS